VADLNSWIRDIENSGLQYDDEVEGEDSDFSCFFWNWRRHPLGGEPATSKVFLELHTLRIHLFIFSILLSPLGFST
jgi:hypothetical protein